MPIFDYWSLVIITCQEKIIGVSSYSAYVYFLLNAKNCVSLQGEGEPFKPYRNRFHVPYKTSQSTSPLCYSIKRASAYIVVFSSYSALGNYYFSISFCAYNFLGDLFTLIEVNVPRMVQKALVKTNYFSQKEIIDHHDTRKEFSILYVTDKLQHYWSFWEIEKNDKNK